MYDDKVIKALATIREFTRREGRVLLPGQVVQAINVLDNAGIFAALDEQTDYASAEEILAESALDSVRMADLESLPQPPVQLSGRTPVDEPLYGAAADRVRDGLNHPHTHVFASSHSAELCYGSEVCTLTYGEFRNR